MSAFNPLFIPRFRLPALVATIAGRLPQWPHAIALTTAMNALARLKILPRESLDLLEGRTFLIDVLDAGGQACFTFRDGVFRPVFAIPDTTDLTFRANLSAFLQLAARQEDPDTLFFNRELTIEGDTELGLVVKNMLDAIEWPKIPEFAAFPEFPIFRHRV